MRDAGEQQVRDSGGEASGKVGSGWEDRATWMDTISEGERYVRMSSLRHGGGCY